MIRSKALDYQYMARALRLAARGLYTTSPNPRVGCVLVRDGRVVGEGWHQRAGGAHAEIHALEQAGEQARGSTAYVTLEPCCHHGRTPPCSKALIEAGVARVVVAMNDPNPKVAGQGVAELEKAGIEVVSGVLASEAAALNPGFVSRMVSQRPYVRCKMAMTLDGRTAMQSGQSKWITSPAARYDVQLLRARSCAIVSGIGTVITDDPMLTVRLDEIGGHDHLPSADEFHQPLRVIVDSQLRTPVDARLFSIPGKTLIVTASENPEKEAMLKSRGAEVVCLPGENAQVMLAELMQHLGQRQVNEVLVESGAILGGALLEAGLIDELVIYMAPRLMGDQARGLFHLEALADIAQCRQLEIDDIRAVGDDWRISARVLNG